MVSVLHFAAMKKYTRDSFLVYLEKLTELLSVDIKSCHLKISLIEESLVSLGAQLREIMDEREITRNLHKSKKEDHRLTGIHKSESRKNLWAEIDRLETKFITLTDDYRSKCQEIAKIQNQLAINKKIIDDYESIITNLTKEVDYLTITTIKLDTEEIMQICVVPEFANIFGFSDIWILNESSPIGNAVLGRSTGELAEYSQPNGRNMKLEILQTQHPSEDFCKVAINSIYKRNFSVGNTYRIGNSMDSTHVDRTVDGARENWLLQCSVCGGYNGKNHRCKCYFL